METNVNTHLAEYPEIVGKTVKNIIYSLKTVILEFTDGSVFNAYAAEKPGALYILSGHFNSGIDRSGKPITEAYVEKPLWPTIPGMCSADLVIKTYAEFFRCNILCKSSEVTEVQLDTKYTSASDN